MNYMIEKKKKKKKKKPSGLRSPIGAPDKKSDSQLIKKISSETMYLNLEFLKMI